jgi:hypothetical protein
MTEFISWESAMGMGNLEVVVKLVLIACLIAFFVIPVSAAHLATRRAKDPILAASGFNTGMIGGWVAEVGTAWAIYVTRFEELFWAIFLMGGLVAFSLARVFSAGHDQADPNDQGPPAS